MTERFFDPFPQYGDDAGNPLVSGTLDFFETGGSVRKATFADAGQNIQNNNPVKLTAAGRVPNIFYAGTARVVLKTGAGVVIEDKDVVGLLGSGAGFDTWSSVVEYENNAYVIASDDNIYRSLQNNNLGNDPTITPSFWEAVEFVGNWNANITYSNTDIVKATDGLLYGSRVNNNLDNDPTGGGNPTEWGPASFGTLLDLFDTPANYTGAAGKTLKVNPAGTAVEFVSATSIASGDSPYVASVGEVIAADVTGGTINVTWDVTSAVVGDTLIVSNMEGLVATNALTITLTGGNFTVTGATDTVLNIVVDNTETIMTVLSIGPVLVGAAS